MTKSELRASIVARFRASAVSAADREAASGAICQAIRRHPAWDGAKSVAAFLALPSEPQLATLWETGPERQFCFPRIRGDRVELIHLADHELLRRSDWKFESDELATAPVIPPGEIDLFLVPGFAFTASGQRLGRGGGFYDRLLARRSAQSIAIGVCFSARIVEALPRESHDQDVDLVVTECGVMSHTPRAR